MVAWHCGQDSPSAISKAALSGADPIASEAVDIFLAIIGAEAGHMGLRLLAKGGVYICGGITPKVPSNVLCRRVCTCPMWTGTGLGPCMTAA